MARSSLSPRRWAIWQQAPNGLAFFVLLIDGGTAAWSIISLIGGPDELRPWIVAGLLVLLAVWFEEGGSRIARLQWRLNSDLKRDMASVWAVAAAVALPAAQASVFIAVVFAHSWWRQQRPNGRPLFRGVFSLAGALLPALLAGVAGRQIASLLSGLPWGVNVAASIVGTIAVFTLSNRAIVSVALVWVGARGRALIGTLDDNLTELATLCIGGLIGLAAMESPLLCVLAIVPMAMLQRGAFVRELETAAVTDTKTGLLNAIGWEQLAQRELVRARREEYPLSILIIDIDHFKRVNDRHGHLVGDMVLSGLATSLRSALREYDTLGRFGGEEFVVLLPDTGEDVATQVAERVRARINGVTIGGVSDVEDDDLLSVSIGIASSVPADLVDAEVSGMLLAADRALYRAKNAGRNRAYLADDSLDVDEMRDVDVDPDKMRDADIEALCDSTPAIGTVPDGATAGAAAEVDGSQAQAERVTADEA